MIVMNDVGIFKYRCNNLEMEIQCFLTSDTVGNNTLCKDQQQVRQSATLKEAQGITSSFIIPGKATVRWPGVDIPEIHIKFQLGALFITL